MNNTINKTIVTKIKFTIKSIWKNFSTVEKWSTDRLGGQKSGRKSCRGCNRSWLDIKIGGVHLCMIVEGKNKLICDICLSKLDSSLITRG